MKKINTKITGNKTLSEDSAFFGLITGNLKVTGKVEFDLFGLVSGNLTIKKGVTARLYGLVNGDVINEGKLEVLGIVNGKIVNNGEVMKGRKAIVKGGITKK